MSKAWESPEKVVYNVKKCRQYPLSGYVKYLKGDQWVDHETMLANWDVQREILGEQIAEK